MLRFFWNSVRGYWLKPWESPYLKWRIETYAGIPAETVTREIFFKFLLAEKKSLFQYFRWVGRMAKR